MQAVHLLTGILVVLAGVLPAAAQGPTAATEEQVASRKKLLLIGIDGCRYDALQRADTPHLDALLERGAVAEPIRIFPPDFRGADTISGPGWSNILCGVWPDKHGVLDNKFTSPKYDQFPHFFTRLKQARPAAETASFSDWAPIAEIILRDADTTVEASAQGDEYIEHDTFLAKRAAELLRAGNPDATVVYLGQVDETGHKEGFHPSVPAYVAAIERVDALVGQLLAAVRERGSYTDEDWLVLVTTDHGGSGTGHSGGHDNPDVACSWMIVSGKSSAKGRIEKDCGQVDIVATALIHLGVAIQPEWQLDGKSVGLAN